MLVFQSTTKNNFRILISFHFTKRPFFKIHDAIRVATAAVHYLILFNFLGKNYFGKIKTFQSWVKTFKKLWKWTSFDAIWKFGGRVLLGWKMAKSLFSLSKNNCLSIDNFLHILLGSKFFHMLFLWQRKKSCEKGTYIRMHNCCWVDKKSRKISTREHSIYRWYLRKLCTQTSVALQTSSTYVKTHIVSTYYCVPLPIITVLVGNLLEVWIKNHKSNVTDKLNGL